MNADKSAPMNADDCRMLELFACSTMIHSPSDFTVEGSIGGNRRASIGVHRRFQRVAYP